MRRITANFSIRKRLPFKLFGANVSEIIRIPVNPLVALGAMVLENIWHKPKRRLTRK